MFIRVDKQTKPERQVCARAQGKTTCVNTNKVERSVRFVEQSNG